MEVVSIVDGKDSTTQTQDAEKAKSITDDC